MSKLPPTGESKGYDACPDEVALPAQIECCERERRLTDSKAGVLAQGAICQAIYSPILTASALRWKKTRLAAAPLTVIIIVGVQSILSLPFPSLPSQKEKATGR